mgnify:CR=1 FL=1
MNVHGDWGSCGECPSLFKADRGFGFACLQNEPGCLVRRDGSARLLDISRWRKFLQFSPPTSGEWPVDFMLVETSTFDGMLAEAVTDMVEEV